uniref:N-acetyltransferase domain-containing protein n=1 Tax=Strongyloides venezuelensis TaxID=75913 RepID=A0A0K0F7L3_STRVS
MSESDKNIEVKFNNNFTIRFISPKDKDSVLNILLEEFLITEPLNRGTGITKDQINKIFQYFINDNFVMNNSFGAYNKEKELVGIRLVNLTKREDDNNKSITEMNERDNNEENVDISPDIIITNILDEAKIGIWKLLPPTINTLVRSEIVCVARKWQRQGIASKLETEGNKILINKYPEIQGIIAEATSVANQHLLSKQGYKIYRKVYFKKYNIPIGYDGSDHVETMIKLF